MMTFDAEQSVLGGLMIASDQRAALASLEWLTADDFARKDHQLLFGALSELIGRGDPADAVTMGDWIESNGIAELVGGADYILHIAANTPSAANITAYAEIVVEASKLRKLAKAGETIAAAASRGTGSASEIAMAWHPRLLELTDNRRREAQGMKSVIAQMWDEMREDFERKGPRGMLTPWAAVNKLIPDIREGELVVIGGRPGMGKSTLAVQIAQVGALGQKRRVGIWSLEMPATQVSRRMLASAADVPLKVIRNPELMQDDYWPRLTTATALLNAAAIVIDDQAGLTAEQICARARREHMREPLGLIVIDHFHRLRLAGKDPRHAMNDASARFKDLARELEVPVILLAQLNRAVEKQGNQRPSMADLRECGALEQDADWIVLLYRDEYYNPNSNELGILEAIVAKARDGETGTAKLRWRGDVSRVDELPDGWEAPPQRTPTEHRGFRRGVGA